MDATIPLKNILIFVLILVLVASVTLTMLFQSGSAKTRKPLLYFMAHYWLILVSYSVWGLASAIIVNGLFLLSVQFVLFGYIFRYKLAINNTAKLLLVVQWIFFIFAQLIHFDAEFVRQINILVNVSILGFIAFILILKNANFENNGEKISLVATATLTVLMGFYLPAYLLNQWGSRTDFIYQLMVCQTFSSMIIYSALLVSFLNDQVIQNQKDSVTDAMTGLFNRRYLMQQGDVILSLTHRHKNPASVMICDIDKFKNVNDKYGHDIGDKAIIKFADTLKNTVRQEDLLARFGGEEFVVLMPATTLQDAQLLAERLREETEKIKIRTEGEVITFTASFGVSEVTSSILDEEIKMADKALFDAKKSGRNQVCLYAQPD